MSDQGGSNEAGWQPDPHGRHEYRYWDGTAWTDQVSDGGVVSTDPPGDTGADSPTEVTEPVSATDTVASPVAAAQPLSGPPSTDAPAGPPSTDAPYVPPSDDKPKRKVPVGILALVGLAVAAIVAAAVIFLGGDEGGGTGEFSGELTDDDPFFVRTFDLDAGEGVRAIVTPDDDLDARITLGVDPEVASSALFVGTDDIDVDDLLSSYSFNYDSLLASDSIDDDLSGDISEALSDDFSDFQELLTEEVPSLEGAGVPFGTTNENEEGDAEGFIFVAPLAGEYAVIISGGEGEFEGNVDTAGPSDDFDEIDPDDDLENEDYYEIIEPLREDLCEEEFWDGDPGDVNSEAGQICDDDEFDALLSGDLSEDFSDDFTNDFSDDFTDDFSDDFTDDFSDDFTDDFSDDFTDDFSDDFSDDDTDVDQGSISVGDSASGFITAGTRDVYTIVGDGSQVTIDVIGSNDTGGLDPTVALEDSFGDEIDYNDDADPSDIGDSQLRVRLDDGETYTIAVAGFGSSTGDYELIVS